MYIPKQFAEESVGSLHALMRAEPLATLAMVTAAGLEAHHIPLVLDPTSGGMGVLLGHVSRQNPLWRAASPQTKVIAIFAGPSAYISPAWYPNKRESGKVVPTWNYVAVHAHGTLRVHDDPAWIRTQIDLLTKQQEAGRADPWSVSDAPADYIDNMLRAIVGIEIVIERLEGKWKLSQNQPSQNQAAVARTLRDAGNPAMADLIERRTR